MDGGRYLVTLYSPKQTLPVFEAKTINAKGGNQKIFGNYGDKGDKFVFFTNSPDHRDFLKYLFNQLVHVSFTLKIEMYDILSGNYEHSEKIKTNNIRVNDYSEGEEVFTALLIGGESYDKNNDGLWHNATYD